VIYRTWFGNDSLQEAGIAHTQPYLLSVCSSTKQALLVAVVEHDHVDLPWSSSTALVLARADLPWSNGRRSQHYCCT
jgi:hypothetical protein